MQIGKTLVLIASLALATACRKDKSADEEKGSAEKGWDVATYKKKQADFADSVIRSAPNAKKVAEKLGQKYEVGSVMLRDSIAVLARDPKLACYDKGKKLDPYLAGTVSFWVNMSVVGSDVIRVQESTWTSKAGDLVDECLLGASKAWKFSAAFGAPNAYIVQVQFR